MEFDVLRSRPGSWRLCLAWWPIEWRQKWADRAEAAQVGGLDWRQAEWLAFVAVVEEINAREAELGRGTIRFEESAPSMLDDDAVSKIRHEPTPEGSVAESIEIARRHNRSLQGLAPDPSRRGRP
jgi:hypothetical protein